MFLLKIGVAAVAVAAASEVAKRIGPFWAAVIIALPLTSALALMFTYWDTRDTALVNALARDIAVIVPVSLLFFVPFLLAGHTRWGFAANMLAGTALLSLAVWLLRRFLPSLLLTP